jgi:hypothetical protein
LFLRDCVDDYVVVVVVDYVDDYADGGRRRHSHCTPPLVPNDENG